MIMFDETAEEGRCRRTRERSRQDFDAPDDRRPADAGCDRSCVEAVARGVRHAAE